MKTQFHFHRGFSLIELMIAMTLGLFLTGAALSIMLSNRQAFVTSENLSLMQGNARTAFDFMTRDIRAAGGNPCGANLVTNVLANANAAWWANWTPGSLRGFENSQAGDAAQAIVPVGVAPGNRAAGTDAILLLSGNMNEGVVVSTHNAAAAPPNFRVTTAQHGLAQGNIVMVCDSRSAAIFEITNNPAGTSIEHAAGGPAPGNSRANLNPPLLSQYPQLPNLYQFEAGALLTRLHGAFWYVGNNGRGNNSLYRVSVDGTSAPRVDEIIEGAQNLQVDYVQRNLAALTLSNWINANTVTNWINPAPPGIPFRVEAVRVTLTLQSRDPVGTNNLPITTTLAETTYLRNRE